MTPAKAQTIARLGFGLDWQYRDRYPQSMAELRTKYDGRLSHLSVVSLPSAGDARVFMDECARGLPVVHHLPGVAPAAPGGPNLELYTRLEAVSDVLDAVWTCEDIGLWSIGPYPLPYFTPPLFEPELADHVVEGIRTLHRLGRYPFVPEIPSCTLAVGRMSLGDFFHRVTDGADCDLLLDVAHVFSYAVAARRPFAEVLRSLPLERVVEIHVAGGYIDPTFDNRYLDTHSHSVAPAVIDLLQEAVAASPRLRAVTYEIGVGLDAGNLDEDFGRIEELLAQTDWTPAVVGASGLAPAGAA
ncbi:multinuclear nonheme iron-dependent oxidase [Streptomyces sp. NPDC054783]